MTFAIDTYAVMGNPVSHSLSPRVHKEFAKQTGEHLDYQAIEVPLEKLESAINHFLKEGGKGLNITVPFKQQAFVLMTQCSKRANLAQAVNTIIIQPDGRLVGDNTDGIGLIRDITWQQENLRDKRILILGAGGAVRGILGPLLAEKPSEIIIVNRTETTATFLASAFSKLGIVRSYPLDAIAGQQFDLIINGTSASLTNQTLALPEHLLTPEGWCYDLAYSSQLTAFQRWARQQGARKYLDGLGMLIEQAAEAFYLWRGIRPETRPVLKLLQAR
ncbi:MAG: shikimate dehydrogenase [Gammaproteobacteria bacterium]